MNFPVFAHGFDLPILHEMLKIGLPLGLNTSLYSVGHVLLQALYNTLGSTFVAGCSVAGKVSGIANIAITSYSSAATVGRTLVPGTIVVYAVGHGRYRSVPASSPLQGDYL